VRSYSKSGLKNGPKNSLSEERYRLSSLDVGLLVPTYIILLCSYIELRFPLFYYQVIVCISPYTMYLHYTTLVVIVPHNYELFNTASVKCNILKLDTSGLQSVCC
jgi:hypothetical protein